MKVFRGILIAIVIAAGLAIAFRYLLLGTYIEIEDVAGLSEAEIREQFGDPDWIVDSTEDGQFHWVYHHGLRGSSLEFEDGVVVGVHHATR